MSALLGAIADDFTGATDLANTLARSGLRVIQILGAPNQHTRVDDAQALVVALKSRTAPVDEAVEWSVSALRWLQSRGVRQYFFKYCSTFDSTAKGNIGPVADALLAALNTDFAFVCPAFPENGRTVYRGHLFVGDDLLSESSMQNHPLTPMRDSSLVRLMAAQSRHQVGMIPLPVVRQGPEAIRAKTEALRSCGTVYAVVDALTDEDLLGIGRAAAEHTLVTGGSAIAQGLAQNLLPQSDPHSTNEARLPTVSGRPLVLAGSCSEATRNQIDKVRGHWPTRKLDVAGLLAGTEDTSAIIDWATRQNGTAPVLIYASSDPSEVTRIQSRFGVAEAGALVEQTMGKLAHGLAAHGFTRIVVAGGETAGAVVSALGVDALHIGPEIDPGVPWTESLGEPRLALALKSGNFGAPDFFHKAFEVWT